MASLTLRGGEKLERALAEIAAKLDKKASLRVGFLEGSTEPNGESTAMVMAVQEFGDLRGHVPARSYFRPMIEAKSPRWGAALGASLVAQNYDVTESLNTMGHLIGDQLQDSIRAVTSPPLAKSTILKRAKNVTRARKVGPTIAKPLIDTGTAIRSVAHEVRDGDDE